MQTTDLAPVPETLDELTRLQLSISQRADELMRMDDGSRGRRDFWQEAEAEIWARFGELLAQNG